MFSLVFSSLMIFLVQDFALATDESETQTDILGKRFPIYSVPKGTDDNSYLTLCDIEWVFRELPSGYFPRVHNEIICAGSSCGCLSNYGKCFQVWRNVDVVRSEDTRAGILAGSDTDNWVKETIKLGSGCNCRVKAGSAIHNLVTG
ncbi:MAG: hypothetical protein QM487_12185 [Candidatus Marithrix sp.]